MSDCQPSEIALVYLLAGFVFAVWFAFKKVNHFDEEAKGAPLTFRLLIIPGSALLWIFLLEFQAHQYENNKDSNEDNSMKLFRQSLLSDSPYKYVL